MSMPILSVRRTEDGEVVVPADIAGPLAALIRTALPLFVAEWGSQIPWHRELRALEQPLAASARGERCPQSDTAERVVREDGDALVTVTDAAMATGINPRTLRRWCDAGRVRGATRIGRSWMIPARWVTARQIEETGNE